MDFITERSRLDSSDLTRPIRVALADGDERGFLLQMLQMIGFDVVIATTSGSELLEQYVEKAPDVVIAKTKLCDMDGVEAARHIYAKRPVAILFISDSVDQNNGKKDGELDEAGSEFCLARFKHSPSRLELEVAISVSLTAFSRLRQVEEKVHQLEQDLQQVKTTLDNRKTIERAKGIIMKWAGIDEPQAHRRLQKLARDKNLKLIDMAMTIVELDTIPNTSRSQIQ